MSKIIAKSDGDRQPIDPVPQGVHIARCYLIADIGTHHDDMYDKDRHEIIVTWELPDERIDVERDGEKVNLPRAISKTYTLSLGEKANLRKDLVCWRGRDFTDAELAGFDLENILGKSCQIQVVHKAKRDGGVSYRIGAVMALPKGMKHETPENPCRTWSIGDPTDDVPKWMVERAMKSKEWTSRTDEGHEQAEPDKDETEDDGDQLPF